MRRGPSPDIVRKQVERIVQSPSFARSERLRSFLRFIVEESLQDRAQDLKEYSIALAVCSRDSSFDPKIDPIVRVDASRLRARLEAYYHTEGLNDPISIELRRGSYVPLITAREHVSSLVAVGPRVASVAVLPFVNLWPNSNGEGGLGEGIAEELIRQLGRTRGLRVVARASAFQLRGMTGDLRRVATDLNVSHIVEGSVRCTGEQLRVDVQLTEVRECTVRWSAQYERSMNDLLVLQQDISRDLAKSLKVPIVAMDDLPELRAPVKGQAHIEYLKGRHFWNRRTATSLVQSLEHYNRAIELDPTHAQAYAGIADTLLVQALNEQVSSTHALPRARVHADRALHLQVGLAEALVSSGAIASVFEWDWRRSESLFRRAIAVNANLSLAPYLYAVHNLSPRNRGEEALIEMDRALELDPVSPVLYRDLGMIHYLRGNYGEAEEALVYARDLDPAFQTATFFWTGRTFAEQGRFSEALQLFEARLAAPRPNTRVLAMVVHTLWRMGRRAEARERFNELQRLAATGGVPALNLAIAYLGIEEHEPAMRQLQRACINREVPLYQIAVDPLYDPLIEDSSFAAVLARMGLASAARQPDLRLLRRED